MLSPFYLNHYGRCIGIFHFGFNLHFPNGCWCRTSFHVLICHLYVVFCEMFLPAFDCWGLRVLYIFSTAVLHCVVYTYFLPVCSLFFHSLYQVFSRAKVFNLDKNNFLYLITRYLWKILSKIMWNCFYVLRDLSPLMSHKFSLHSNNGNRIVTCKFANCFTSPKLFL